MPPVVQRYATPLVTGLFLVSLVSGLALFFHLGASRFREMHEWLSLVLVLPFALHLWRNWRSFLNYLRHPPMAASLGLSLAVALGFALSAGGGGEGREGPPQFAFTDAILQNTVADVAPLLDTTPDALTARLTAAGFAVDGPDEPLVQVAGGDSSELVQALTLTAS